MDEHWWAQPGLPVPPNPAPERLSTAAWRQLVSLGHRHMRAYRRMRYELRELRLTCTPAVSDAAEQILEDALDLGHVLHVLGSPDDARGCMDDLTDDVDALVALLRQRQGLPTLTVS